ncbi:Uncharacterised protein [uncultured archaeon]|nr:Uncharacterised protein [uncultured archaeon]
MGYGAVVHVPEPDSLACVPLDRDVVVGDIVVPGIAERYSVGGCRGAVALYDVAVDYRGSIRSAHRLHPISVRGIGVCDCLASAVKGDVVRAYDYSVVVACHIGRERGVAGDGVAATRVRGGYFAGEAARALTTIPRACAWAERRGILIRTNAFGPCVNHHAHPYKVCGARGRRSYRYHGDRCENDEREEYVQGKAAFPYGFDEPHSVGVGRTKALLVHACIWNFVYKYILNIGPRALRALCGPSPYKVFLAFQAMLLYQYMLRCIGC